MPFEPKSGGAPIEKMAAIVRKVGESFLEAAKAADEAEKNNRKLGDTAKIDELDKKN